MRLQLLVSVVGLIVVCASQALAQDSGPIQTVEVKGTLENELPQLLSRTGTQVDLIPALTIKNGGYLDLSQALAAEAPGLYIASQHGPFDYVDVSLLGSRTADVLWLVDGVRINNRLYAGTTPLDSLPAGMVDHIEIVQGGQALFYGTQAIAGAVNIITRPFSDAPQAVISLGGDTNGGANLDGYFSDSVGRSKFVIYGSGNRSDGFLAFPLAEFQPSETLRKRGYRVFNGGAKYQFEATDDLRVTATYNKSLGHLDYPAPELINTAFNQRNQDLLTAKLDYTPSDALQFFVKGYYNWWKSHYTEFDNDPAGGLDVIDDHDRWGYVDRGVTAMGKVGLVSGLSAVLGYDYQNYNGSDAVLVISRQSEQVHAVFGQLQAEDLVPKLHLALGFRYNMPDVGQSAFVWNASGQYDLTDELYVKASVGTNFRLPTAEELFADDPLDERGNPNLLPERSVNANGSIGGQIDLGPSPLDWHVTGFYRRIKNLIDYATFDPVTSQDVFGNVAGAVITHGFEAYVSAPLGNALSAFGDFTYAKAHESGSTQQFRRIPKTVLKIGVDYHPMNLPLGASLSLQNIGGLQDTVGGGVGDVGYGGYVVVNLGARVFLDPDHRHRLGINLNNVFDENYATRLTRGIDDVTGDSYLVHVRGMPRTLLVNYTYSLR